MQGWIVGAAPAAIHAQAEDQPAAADGLDRAGTAALLTPIMSARAWSVIVPSKGSCRAGS
ncbi:hypothetical protein [Pseudomonas aeruginosa]|uniref:hypothetical protein n=1 Tax=Pseudomonas aeruginosa TaxID=287 RepID=UPI0029CA9582|nr:hypothetical protein [Pseudomonas aeruginosa]